DPLAVALLAGDVVAGVDASLGADTVAALHRDHGKQVNVDAFFRELDRAGEAGQSAPDDDHTTISCTCHNALSYLRVVSDDDGVSACFKEFRGAARSVGDLPGAFPSFLDDPAGG